MLRKIDCVMVRVADLRAATEYYSGVFGLKPIWHDTDSVDLGFPETDAELVLHSNPDIPSKVEVHYLVDDVVSAVLFLREKGCSVLAKPFDIPIGKCAVIADPFGVTLCILDMSKGPRKVATAEDAQLAG